MNNSLNLQFYLYILKSQQESPQGALDFKVKILKNRGKTLTNNKWASTGNTPF